MSSSRRVGLTLLVLPCAAPLVARAQVASSGGVRGLPIAEVRAEKPNGRLAVVLSGDGGWIAFDKELAAGLAANGISVAGLDSRAYLRNKRAPEDVAADVARIIRRYATEWGTTRVTMVGYSRGADMAPFVINRLPPTLRDSVDQLVLIGLAANANFQFHWEDLVHEVKRPDDVPTRPEVEQFFGRLPVLCLYGDDDKSDTCRDYPSTPSWRAIRHGDGHRITDAALVVRAITGALSGR